MNKLRGTICYESGAMDHPNAKGGHDWRRWITPKLWEFGIGVINPCDKPISIDTHKENPENRKLVQIWKDNGEFDKVREHYKPITHIDLRMVDKADFLLVFLDIEQFPCGTYDEIYMAALQRKPILIVCPHGKSHIPNWLFGRIPHELFFASFEEMLEYLDRLDKGLEPDLGRWVFFDYDKMFGLTK